MGRHSQVSVADMVAHDAAAGFPGWARAVSPRFGRLAWAEQVVMGGTPATQAVTKSATTVVLLALAHAMTDFGPDAARLQLLVGLVDDLIHEVHGPETADLVGALLTWWGELTAEEQSMTGVLTE